MKIEDLRIGNKVLVHGDFEMTVTALLAPNTVYLDFEGNEGGVWEEDIRDIEPVPISKELLEDRLGAVDRGREFISYYLHGMEINFIASLWLEYVSRVEITGLHHLQNIYFFRMSEELKIKD